EKYRIKEEDAACFISSDALSTDMYSEKDDSIGILYKDGTVKDISRASDMLNIELLSKKVVKHYFAYLRD
ncbi:MAG: phosphohydrolase, partial [bacterium]|nr:phosphohydrolase [bacterium]